MTRTVLRLAVCVLCCFFTAPAMAQAPACDAQPVAALPMVLLNGKILVIVQANGQSSFFAIDTGGFASSVSENLAARLKLKTFPIRTYMELRDFGEARADKYALLDSLQIGNLKAGADRYMVADLGPGIDGLIAPDYLRNFDLDFDFAASRLTLYKPGACSGHPPGATAFSAVDMDVSDQGHMRIPVLLDGKRVRAMVDTGAASTYLTATVARGSFDVAMGAAKGTVRGAANGTLAVAPHEFATLQIGDFTQKTPTIGLVERDSFENSAPLLLGMAQLRGFRFYVAYRERRMYVSQRPAQAAPP